MSKTYITVDNVLKRLGSYTPIRMGILIALFTIPGLSIQAAQEMEYFDRPLTQIELSAPSFSSTPLGQAYAYNNAGVELFMGSTFSVTDQLKISFEDLCKSQPAALEMQPAFTLISDGIGEIMAEKVTVSCDIASKVLNVSYRLPGDILLSVNKPLVTMDDAFVMFNVYHQRELLVTDTARIDLLAEYVRNVEKRIAEQA